MGPLAPVLLAAALAIVRTNAAPTAALSCDPSYPDVCLPPISEIGDLECAALGFGGFTVYAPDPHFLDGDFDGIGCELT